MPSFLNDVTMFSGVWIREFALYFLVFARVIGVFVLAPLFSKPRGVPMPVQVGYALAISFVLFHTLPPHNALPDTVMVLGVAMGAQFLLGLTIGFAAYLVPAAVQFAGSLIDLQMGLTVIATFDPSEGGMVNIMREFEFRLSILAWIFIHGDYYLFRAMQKSFEVVSPTSFAVSGLAAKKLVEMSGMIFSAALEISAPVLIAIFITHVMLGLLNRAAPQINVYLLSYPLNIVVGIGFVLIGLYPTVLKAFPALYDRFNLQLASLISSMRYY